jgi:hypothetical protein
MMNWTHAYSRTELRNIPQRENGRVSALIVGGIDNS